MCVVKRMGREICKGDKRVKAAIHHCQERGMREGRVDLIRERESGVKNEFVRHCHHDGRKRRKTAERGTHG